VTAKPRRRMSPFRRSEWDQASKSFGLTAQETRVLWEMHHSEKHGQIARTMDIPISRVRQHWKSVKHKLDLVRSKHHHPEIGAILRIFNRVCQIKGIGPLLPEPAGSPAGPHTPA
jgi:DNA-binding CsgD family transcriptional regulator